MPDLNAFLWLAFFVMNSSTYSSLLLHGVPFNTCIHVCVYTYSCIDTHVCVFMSVVIYVCIYVFFYVCTHACIDLFTFMHIMYA